MTTTKREAKARRLKIAADRAWRMACAAGARRMSVSASPAPLGSYVDVLAAAAAAWKTVALALNDESIAWRRIAVADRAKDGSR